MRASAAAPLARRAEWTPVLLLAGYLLLAPSAFVLGPLAGLLLLSHPRTVREWLWIVVGAGTSIYWLQQHGTLAGQVVRAAAVQVTGAYLVLTLLEVTPAWRRALHAMALAGVGLVLLMTHAGIQWDALQLAVADGIRGANGVRVITGLLPPDIRTVTAIVADYLAVLFPALLMMIGVGGVQLAWTWHCRLAERPIGERFCTGEFNL